MIRSSAPSRLHFGLFRLPVEADNQPDDLRNFGGVGLMIDKPGVAICLTPAKKWSATGPLADRALAFAHEFLRNSMPQEYGANATPAFAVAVEHCAPEHVGLGTGTQLGLAVARALARALGRTDPGATLLAQRIGRGHRSALGIHGFDQGGLLVDGGKKASTATAPLLAHYDFPRDWGILLVMPRNVQGTHGAGETTAFAELAKARAAQPTDTLCRLVLLGILPALMEHDLPAFGAAVYEFNRRVGEMFKPWQGDVYAHPQTTAIVAFLRKKGTAAVGQSSWGPTVFAIEDVEKLAKLAAACRDEFGSSAVEVIVTGAAGRRPLDPQG